MGNNIDTDHIWNEITETILEISNISGLPAEIVMKIVMESVFDERAGKSEEECRRFMSENFNQYKVECLAHATTR